MVKSLVLVLALARLACAQSPAAPEARGPDPMAVLKQAAAAQNAARFAGEVHGFRVSLFLQIDDPERGRLDFHVERKFKLPDRIWTRVREDCLTHAEYQEGYDGSVAWRFDEKSGERTVYEGPDFKTDRKKILREVAEMRRLLKFFFLQDLLGELEDVEFASDPESEENYVVRGRGKLPDEAEEETPARFTVTIQKDTYVLLEAEVRPEKEREQGSSALRFRFQEHRETSQGVVVPGHIEVFRGDRAVNPSETIALYTDFVDDGADEREVNDIEFNVGFDDTVFSPPAE